MLAPSFLLLECAGGGCYNVRQDAGMTSLRSHLTLMNVTVESNSHGIDAYEGNVLAQNCAFKATMLTSFWAMM